MTCREDGRAYLWNKLAHFSPAGAFRPRRIGGNVLGRFTGQEGPLKYQHWH